MLGKLKTIGWFLKRPEFFPHFFYIAKARLSGKLDNGTEKHEAIAWCNERALSTEEALKLITGKAVLPICMNCFLKK